VLLRNHLRTGTFDGRRLLRQTPPRSIRHQFAHPAQTRQRNPGGRKSPRAPIIASATIVQHRGTPSGLHRYTVCMFPAPVLRAYSSAHHTPELEDVEGCRRPSLNSHSLLRLRPHHFHSPGEFCRTSEIGHPLRFSGLITPARPLQRAELNPLIQTQRFIQTNADIF